MEPSYHRPVLLEETLAGLDPKPGEIFFDGTVGGGGHSEAILQRILPDGFLYGTDQDADALAFAQTRLGALSNRFELWRLNFQEALRSCPMPPLDGILLDIGVSSYQLDTAERGFSFMKDGPLDMRMDQRQALTAADIVNTWNEEDIANVLWEYGEERFSRRIARMIVKYREDKPFTTTLQLAEAIARMMPRSTIHPATRTFQGLRIAVNRELAVLADAIPLAVERLKPGGRLAIISFHSLEDRIVKTTFKRLATGCQCPPKLPCVCNEKPVVRLLKSKPFEATEEEIRENPRSRSAKLRVVQKLEATSVSR